MDAYIYQGDIYCPSHATAIMIDLVETVENTGDSAVYPQGPYPNGGGEADIPQHCGSCGVFLENPLTTDGEDYVRKAMILTGTVGYGTAQQAVAQWKAFYDYL